MANNINGFTIAQMLELTPNRMSIVSVVRDEAIRLGYNLGILNSFSEAADAIEQHKDTTAHPLDDARMVEVLRLASKRWVEIRSAQHKEGGVS